MNSEQRTWTFVTLLLCLTLVAVTAIMAQCSEATEVVDARVGECVKIGGHWNPVLEGGLCERTVK